MSLWWSALPLLFALGCAPAQRGALPPPAPAASTSGPDLRSLDRRASELLAEADDVDQIDRLRALQELLAEARALDTAAQRAVGLHVDRLLAIEARNRNILLEEPPPLQYGAEAGLILEERLPGPPPELPPEPPPPAPAPAPLPTDESLGSAVVVELAPPPPSPQQLARPHLEAARSLALQQKYAEALLALDPCRSEGCWEVAAPVADQLRDAWAETERARINRRYLEARQEPDAAIRLAMLLGVMDDIGAFLQSFPNSAQQPAMEKVLRQVQQDLIAVQVPQ